MLLLPLRSSRPSLLVQSHLDNVALYPLSHCVFVKEALVELQELGELWDDVNIGHHLVVLYGTLPPLLGDLLRRRVMCVANLSEDREHLKVLAVVCVIVGGAEGVKDKVDDTRIEGRNQEFERYVGVVNVLLNKGVRGRKERGGDA